MILKPPYRIDGSAIVHVETGTVIARMNFFGPSAAHLADELDTQKYIVEACNRCGVDVNAYIRSSKHEES